MSITPTLDVASPVRPKSTNPNTGWSGRTRSYKKTEGYKRTTNAHAARLRDQNTQYRTNEAARRTKTNAEINNASFEERRQTANEAAAANRSSVRSENRRQAVYNAPAQVVQQPTAQPTQAVGNATGSAAHGILKIFAVLMGMSLLYLFVKNNGAGGTTIVGKTGGILTAITSGKPLFTQSDSAKAAASTASPASLNIPMMFWNQLTGGGWGQTSNITTQG